MNERIMELAKQAGLYIEYIDLNGKGNLWPTAMSAEECTAAYAIFAKLLLQECIDLANHSNVTGKSIIGERIKEHFGVQE